MLIRLATDLGLERIFVTVAAVQPERMRAVGKTHDGHAAAQIHQNIVAADADLSFRTDVGCAD